MRGVKVKIYKKMYHALFNSVTETIVQLQQAQQQCEAIFMERAPALIKLETSAVDATKAPSGGHHSNDGQR